MGHEAVVAASGAEGLARLRAAAAVDFVITDLKMDGVGGLDVVKAVRELDPDCPVMIVTAFGTVETAVEAMRLGAFDFLQKPFAPEVRAPEGRARARAAARAARPRARRGRERGAARGRRAPVPLRRDRRRVAADAGGVPDHREGRAHRRLRATSTASRAPARSWSRARSTSARSARSGPVREGELRRARRDAARVRAVRPREGRVHRRRQAQARPLRAGRQGHAVPRRDRRHDARRCSSSCCACCRRRSSSGSAARRRSRSTCACVSATHRDLQAEVAAGRFREDLFYRLHVVPCAVPPLRERHEDIPRLVAHFIAKLGPRTNPAVERLDDAALARLCAYGWPGNVRELENVIEQALVFAEGDADRRRRAARLPAEAACPRARWRCRPANVAARDPRGSGAAADPARLRQERRREDRDGAPAGNQDQRALLQAREVRHRRHREPQRQERAGETRAGGDAR